MAPKDLSTPSAVPVLPLLIALPLTFWGNPGPVSSCLLDLSRAAQVTTPPCLARHLPTPATSSPWTPISGVPYHPPRRRARPWHCPLTLLFPFSWPAHWNQATSLSPLAQPCTLTSAFPAPVPTGAPSLRSPPDWATHSPRGISLPFSKHSGMRQPTWGERASPGVLCPSPPASFEVLRSPCGWGMHSWSLLHAGPETPWIDENPRPLGIFVKTLGGQEQETEVADVETGPEPLDRQGGRVMLHDRAGCPRSGPQCLFESLA